MNSQVTDNGHNTSKHKTTNTVSLISKLKSKVNNFDIIDKQGRLIGKVKDLVVNANRQLNFVVENLARSNTKIPLLLLDGKLVIQVEPKTKRVFANINESQLTQLPEYEKQENEVSNMKDNFNASQSTEYNRYSATTGNDEVNNSGEPELIEEFEEDIIRLLGERLVVERSKRKIGEVVIRKEIETRMIQIPVRREKLIVEEPGIEPRQLAEIDLGEEEISQDEFQQGQSIVSNDFESGLTVNGEFDSPKTASLILNAIQLEQNHGCKTVRVSIVVEDEEKQQKYQEWFQRTSKG